MDNISFNPRFGFRPSFCDFPQFLQEKVGTLICT